MAIEMSTCSEQIKAFIMSEVNPELGLTALSDDEPLIESGIVDSLGVLKIMAFLDETFGVDLSSAEINLEHFKDVRTICSLVDPQAV
jgi:acyl carrier protein